MLRDPSAIVELLVYYVVYNDRMLSGVTEGGSCPQVQQARGAKQPGQKYFMTNHHKSEFDRPIVF